MCPNISIDLSKSAPPEPWLYGNIGDAEGLQKKQVWSKSRVMSDILNHRMLSFSDDQQDQWRAVNEFHERFKCSDEVHNLPLTLRAGPQMS